MGWRANFGDSRGRTRRPQAGHTRPRRPLCASGKRESSVIPLIRVGGQRRMLVCVGPGAVCSRSAPPSPEATATLPLRAWPEAHPTDSESDRLATFMTHMSPPPEAAADRGLKAGLPSCTRMTYWFARGGVWREARVLSPARSERVLVSEASLTMVAPSGPCVTSATIQLSPFRLSTSPISSSLSVRRYSRSPFGRTMNRAPEGIATSLSARPGAMAQVRSEREEELCR